MRIAVLILGLVLGALMGVQSYTIFTSPFFANHPDMITASAGGITMALLWLVACALVITFPLASAVLFAVAGVIGFTMGLSSRFEDLPYWGAESLILAVLSVIGWIGKRRGAEREAARHAELLAALRSEQQSP